MPTQTDIESSSSRNKQQIIDVVVNSPEWTNISNRIIIDMQYFGVIPGSNGTADVTANIIDALDYLADIVPWSVSPTRGYLLPILDFHYGAFKVSSTLNIDINGVCFRGDGSNNCILAWYGGDTPVIDIGNFSSTPANLFTGSQEFSMDGMRIQHYSPGTVGSRQGQGIRMSGGGSMVLRDVVFNGLKYGVNNTYGTDFNHYNAVTSEYCDIGLYIGPSCQQFYASRYNSFACDYGVVLDKPVTVYMSSPIFNSCRSAGVLIEGYATGTRQCSSIPGGSPLQSKIVIDHPWFESNAGGLGDNYINSDFILVSNNGSDAYRDIEIRSPYIVAGSTGTKSPDCFWNNGSSGPKAQRVKVTDAVVAGKMKYWFKNGLISFRLNGYRTETGYPNPLFTDTNNTGLRVTEDYTSNLRTEHAATYPYTEQFDDADLNLIPNNGIKNVYGQNGVFSQKFCLYLTTAANQTITADETTKTFTRSSGSFITDGFEIGDDFQPKGIGTNSNFTMTISAITATEITTTSTVYDYSGVGAEQIIGNRWLTRYGYDIQNRRLFFGDPANNDRSISTASAMPSSGTFTTGSFVYNTAPSISSGKILLGWSRLTTGSGHVDGTDWSPCYVTTT